MLLEMTLCKGLTLYLNEYKKQARILHEKDGVPLFVLVPYDEYFRPKRVSEDEGKVYLPHESAIEPLPSPTESGPPPCFRSPF